MNECYSCGFWDSDYESCTCPSEQTWYLCPFESEKKENKKKFDEWMEWESHRGKKNEHKNI